MREKRNEDHVTTRVTTRRISEPRKVLLHQSMADPARRGWLSVIVDAEQPSSLFSFSSRR